MGPADWWVLPAAGLLVDRPAPPPRILSAAACCSLAPDDEGSVEVSVATVCRLEGSHYSLTSSCLLNVAHASREGVAGFWGPAAPLADWGRPGRLRASLWLKGPAARGPYWRLPWVTSRLAWLQCRAGREMAVPYGVLWPCLPRASGVVGRTVATPRLVAVMWRSFGGCGLGRLLGVGALRGRLLGSRHPLRPASWSRPPRGYPGGRLLRLGRLP